LARRPALGFLGASFFLLLAPSSSLVPLVTQTVAEHRMYLPLAVVVTLAVLGVHGALARGRLAAVLVIAAAFAGLTVRRNREYRTEEALWRDTAAKRPQNARAHANLGTTLQRRGDDAGARREYDAAIRGQPDFFLAWLNRADLEQKLGQLPAAISDYESALRIDAGSVTAHHNLAVALDRAGRPQEALPHFFAALAREDSAPAAAATHAALANTLVETNRLAEA